MPHPLEVTWNGRTWTLQPGENPNLPYRLSELAKSQHPIMGTEDPFVVMERPYFSGQWKVGVKETKDPLEPLAANVDEGQLERFNRDEGAYAGMAATDKVEVIRRRPLHRSQAVDGPIVGGGRAGFTAD